MDTESSQHPSSIADDLAYQAHILPGVSRTFALTIPVLPEKLACLMTNAYLLCRLADTIEDDVGLDQAQKSAFHARFVAVVKGEQPDAGTAEADLRRGFLAVVNRLAGRARRVAIATHDVPLAREALRRLGDAGTPGGLELLFGLPARRLIGMGRAGAIPLRLYVPYGRPVLPYRLSQATERPAVMWWATRDVLFRRRSREAAAATKE